MSSELLKLQIIQAGKKAVEQLIKVAKEDIIKPDPEDELAADRLKNAAATKKLAIFDAFDILSKIDQEQENITVSQKNGNSVQTKQGFAERRSK
jgi:ASC-1-like (ASCH) protein|tara:strand:+ start:423 stop:704 length:282 start_codon:yes stop_codon:yes gene_type:complete